MGPFDRNNEPVEKIDEETFNKLRQEGLGSGRSVPKNKNFVLTTGKDSWTEPRGQGGQVTFSLDRSKESGPDPARGVLSQIDRYNFTQEKKLANGITITVSPIDPQTFTRHTQMSDGTKISENPARNRIVEYPNHAKTVEILAANKVTDYGQGKFETKTTYVNEQNKAIGYLIERKGPNAEDNRLYDEGEQVIQNARDLKSQLEHNFHINFNRRTNEPYFNEGNKEHFLREPTLQELIAIERAIKRSGPGYSTNKGQGLNFVFLDGAPLNGDEAANYKNESIYISSGTFRDRWLHVQSEIPYEHELGGNSFEAQITHELAHNYIKQTGLAQKETFKRFAELCGFKKVKDKWYLMAQDKSDGILNDIYLRKDGKWIRHDYNGEPIDSASTLDDKQMQKKALCKLATEYNYNPLESTTEALTAYFLGGESRANLLRSNKNLYDAIKEHDQLVTSKGRYLASSASGFIRNEQGFLVRKTKENLNALQKFEEKALKAKSTRL